MVPLWGYGGWVLLPFFANNYFSIANSDENVKVFPDFHRAGTCSFPPHRMAPQSQYW